MSYRNPFVTSFIYGATEDERAAILAILASTFDAAHQHGEWFAGIHSRGYPGALMGEELEQLRDQLQQAGIQIPFTIAFAGESEPDQLIWHYEPDHPRQVLAFG